MKLITLAIVLFLSFAQVKSEETKEVKEALVQMNTKVSDLKAAIDAKAEDEQLVTDAEDILALLKASVTKALVEHQANITAVIKELEIKLEKSKAAGKLDAVPMQSFEDMTRI